MAGVQQSLARQNYLLKYLILTTIPQFSPKNHIVTLTENASPGTIVVQINATDLDEGANGEIVYSFGKEVDLNLKSCSAQTHRWGKLK